jgi:hypothetical protein
MIDTTGTYHAGYAVATIVYVGYMITLWSRARRLRRQLDSQNDA